MDFRTNVIRIIEFIQNETKENEDLMLLAYKSVKNLLAIELKTIDQQIQSLLSNRDYEKVNMYVEMSKMVSEACEEIMELANKYGLEDINFVEEITENQNEEIQEIVEDEISDDTDIFLEEDKRINYDDYRVDENIAYGLLTDFCHMKPAAFSLDGVRYPARLWKIVLLQTCELLWGKKPNIFESFIDDKFMQGKTRIYFSKDKMSIKKPELINGTEIYVETNLSANSIRDLIVKMLEQYRIPLEAYKIYLSKDLNPLHANKDINEEVVYNNNENIEEEQLVENIEQFDMQDYCEDYDCKTHNCMNENSPYFIMECCNKRNCEYRKKKAIHVITKRTLKKGLCPKCSNHMEKTLFPVEINDSKGKRQKKLLGQWCSHCQTAYIGAGLFHTFTLNKDLTKMDVTFKVVEDEEIMVVDKE